MTPASDDPIHFNGDLPAVPESKRDSAEEHHLSQAFQAEQLVRESKKTRLLKAYVVSDVHLNDHPDDEETADEQYQRRHFREFLRKIKKEHNDETDHLMLVLNGDILDITGSWFGHTLPWDEDTRQVERILLGIVNGILQNNSAVFDALSELLAFNNVRIYYIVGNHDNLLNLFPSAKSLLLERVAPDSKSRNQLLFMNSLESVELGLYVEHGHRFDRFNRPDPSNPLTDNRFCFGDYVNILLINRFVHRVSERLFQLGYSNEVIWRVRKHMHDIEYLRPLSLIPLWIQTVAKQYHRHPENAGKSEGIDSVILSVIAEILNANATKPLFEKLHLPSRWMTRLLHWLVHLPGTLPVVTFLASNIYRHTHTNKRQLQRAQRFHRHRGYRFITFGHTHAPTMLPLSQNGYYFNTGSWKPVINLFKTLEFDETSLEALNPFVRFNKTEFSGILKIEKDLTDPASEPIFSLQTTRSNKPLL